MHLLVHNSILFFFSCLFVCFRFYWAGFPVIPHVWHVIIFTHDLKKKISALTFLDTPLEYKSTWLVK